MITPLLAQADLGGVPAELFKWIAITLIGLVLVACAVYAVLKREGKQSVKIEREDQPVDVRKAAKRFNHDLSEQRYHDHERRLQQLENWRNGLIEKLDADKEEILQAGSDRELRLQKELSDMPGKIVVDILNAQKLGRRE